MSALARQFSRFMSVGVLATGIHVLSALFLNSVMGLEPLRANFGAFLVATVWSFLGHWAWTFEQRAHVRSSAIKFAVLSLLCFAANQSIVYVVTKMAGLPLAVAMVPVVLLIPVLSFWLSRTHVFAPPAAA